MNPGRRLTRARCAVKQSQSRRRRVSTATGQGKCPRSQSSAREARRSWEWLRTESLSYRKAPEAIRAHQKAIDQGRPAYEVLRLRLEADHLYQNVLDYQLHEAGTLGRTQH